MADPTDETLMAFADGLLDEAQMRAIEQRLAADPALQARLEPFLLTGRPLARLYEQSLAATLPDRLIDTVLSAPAPAGTSATVRPSTSTVAAARWFEWPGLLRFAAPLAAGLVVGGLTGWLAFAQLGEKSVGPGGLLIATARGNFARGALADALDATQSGKIHVTGNSAAGSVVVLPRLSFLNAEGVPCRHYTAESDALVFDGVACRMAPGSWRVDVHTPLPAARLSAPSGSTAVRPAITLVEPSAMVGGALDKMMASDAMTMAEEEKWLRNGWSANR
jgi:anti-sigma factor RsiW